MRPIRHFIKFASSMIALGAIAACSGNKNPLEVNVQRCPAIAVVGGTGALTRFIGEEKTAADVAYEATISNVRLDCDQGSQVVSEVNFLITALRGPAFPNTGDISLRYFVAVVRDNSEIVAKEIYETRLRFTGDVQRVAAQEVIRQTLPTIEQARRYDYEILVGFQLDEDDVVYNLLR